MTKLFSKNGLCYYLTAFGFIVIVSVFAKVDAANADKNTLKKACPVIGLKRLKEYAVPSQVSCFTSTERAENRGYDPLQLPAPTPEPTATPVPAGNYEGNWSGELSVTADDCPTAIPGIEATGSYQFDKSIDLNGTDTGDLVKATDGQDRISAGVITSTGFNLVDTNSFATCVNGFSTVTETFVIDDSDEDKLTLSRREAINCLDSNKTCTRTWSGSVSRENLN